MTNFRYKQLGDSDQYSVIGKHDDKEYATFSLIYAHFARPAACKHMELHILQDTAKQIQEKGEIVLLVEICRFVFRSVLKITHEEKGVALCKIYSADRFTREIYRMFASNLDEDYEVKFYRKWMEIKKTKK